MFTENDSRHVSGASQSVPILREWESQLSRSIERVQTISAALREKADGLFGSVPTPAETKAGSFRVSAGGACGDISSQMEALRQAVVDLEQQAARFSGFV